jgi:hypothetical protein
MNRGEDPYLVQDQKKSESAVELGASVDPAGTNQLSMCNVFDEAEVPAEEQARRRGTRFSSG